MRAGQIDLVALAGARAASREWLNRVLHDDAYAREYYGVSWPSPRRRARQARAQARRPARSRRAVARQVRALPARAARPRDRAISACPRTGSSACDHHTCHAAAAYFGSGVRRPRRPWCSPTTIRATGSAPPRRPAAGSRSTRHEAIAERARLARRLLLVRDAAARHEVRRARVQGDGHGALRLGRRQAERAEAALRERLRPRRGHSRRALRWRRPGERYPLLLRATLGLRFDAIAGGAQRLLEDVLLRWARLMHERYGGERLALGGGVFMNVKANMLIAEEEWVRRSLRLPVVRRRVERGGRGLPGLSAGVRAPRACRRRPQPFGPAYLGPTRGRRGGRGGDPRARPRGPVHGERIHERIEERIAELLVRRRRGGALRGAHGVRRPRARQPLDPGQPVRLTAWWR